MSSMRNGIMISRMSIMNGVIVLGTLLVFAPAVFAAPHPLSLTRVAVDRGSFDPGKGQSVVLRYRISQPATVAIAFMGPDNHWVRRVQKKINQAGEQLFR